MLFSLSGIFLKIKAVKAFFTAVKDPTDLSSVIILYEAFKDGKISERYFHNMLANENVMSLVKKRWKYPKVDIEKLLKLDDETFGKQYALFIKKYELDPNILDESDNEIPISD